MKEGNGYLTYIFYICNDELVEVKEDNLYVLECDIESHRSELEDGTVTYCYITDVTPSYVNFLCNFEEKMRKMNNEDSLIEISKEFATIIKENINKNDTCPFKDLDILNRVFGEYVERDVRIAIIKKVEERNKHVYLV